MFAMPYAVLSALAFSLTSTYDAIGDDSLCKSAVEGASILIGANITIFIPLLSWAAPRLKQRTVEVLFWLVIWCSYWGSPLIGFAILE
ncbi:hypothetical protein DL96DRAFT_1623421 [Flagelloscypha sp. PMI_526]|nr:hypothetical protein DL96DRAFT_1623421 [Flagelloscypha sp. PMI_526]